MTKIITIKPFYVNKIWGNPDWSALGLDPQVKTSPFCGEAWLVSAVTGCNSIVTETNQDLASFFDDNLRIITGYQSYPLLTKFINPTGDLSVQVHPDDAYVQKNPTVQRQWNTSCGKAEAWYVMDCQPHAEIIYGHNATDASTLTNMINNGDWSKCLARRSIKVGDFVYIPPGQIHALTAGTAVYEIQQAADITFRLYDYDRRNHNNQLRPLHIKESLAVINVPSPQLEIINHNHGLLINNQYFYAFLWNINYIKEFTPPSGASFLQLTVVSGAGTVMDKTLNQGASIIMWNLPPTITAAGNLKIIVATCLK